MRECHSKVTYSESVGAHAMDVQVGEFVRTYWALWRSRLLSALALGIRVPSACLRPDQFCWGQTVEVGIDVRWVG